MALYCAQQLLRSALVLQLVCCYLQTVSGEPSGRIVSLELGHADRTPQDLRILHGSSQGQLALTASSAWQQQQLLVVATSPRSAVCWRLVSASENNSPQVSENLLHSMAFCSRPQNLLSHAQLAC